MEEMFEKKSDNSYILKTGYWVNSTWIKSRTDEHTHQFVEMVYTFHGSGVHIVNGKKYPVKKGDLLFLDYNCVHAIETDELLEYADIMFKLDHIDLSLKNGSNAFALLDTYNFSEFRNMINKENCKIHFGTSEREEFEMLLKRTMKEQKNPAPGSDFMIRSILNQILVMVFRKMNFDIGDNFPINSDMLSFIKNNCHKQLTLKDIAVNSYYSSSYLGAQFKEFAGVSFTEYISNCRVEKAQELLKRTNDSVENIMAECGFSNRTRFFKKFKEKLGVTPLKYRAMNKER